MEAVVPAELLSNRGFSYLFVCIYFPTGQGARSLEQQGLQDYILTAV